jgi:hypothetical protein
VLQFLQSFTLTVNHSSITIITTHVFSGEKGGLTVDFAAGGTIIRTAHQKQTLGDQLCDSIQGNKSYDTTTHSYIN